MTLARLLMDGTQGLLRIAKLESLIFFIRRSGGNITIEIV